MARLVQLEVAALLLALRPARPVSGRLAQRVPVHPALVCAAARVAARLRQGEGRAAAVGGAASMQGSRSGPVAVAGKHPRWQRSK